MKVAFGLKAHSGWAALIVLGKQGGEFIVVDRRRIELVEEEWAKQPYHAAEDLQPDAARKLVERGVAAGHRIAVRELRAAVKREEKRANEVAACGVLVGNPMPNWSVEQILAVHFRMHQAEGVLFRDALARAAETCGLKLIEVPEKFLVAHSEKVLATQVSVIAKRIATLGKTVGPPWGKDQKEAALVGMIALES